MSSDRPRLAERASVALLLLGALAVYARVAGHEFLNFDDPQYVTENPIVRDGLSLASLRWAFTTFHFYNWAPLTWISHLLDSTLLGDGAGARLVENALIHAAASFVLYRALRRATGDPWPSLLVAGLFALHPLHVQSVAWVSSRKDVLSALFWMLAMNAHVSFARSGARRDRLLLLLFATLGLLSKTIVALLPFALLLLDWWPLRRLARDGTRPAPRVSGLLLEKLPLFVLGAGTVALGWQAQARGGALDLVPLPLAVRLANASLAYWVQLRRMVWPSDLSAFHPLPQAFLATQQGMAIAVGCAAALVAVTAAALALHRRRPWLTVGWFWYLAVFAPMSGVLQLGRQGMADRYAYLPLIGIYLAIAWEGAYVARRWRVPHLAVLHVAAALLVLCAVASAREVGFWRDSVTLFERALAVTSDNAAAHNNLGAALHAQGHPEMAIEHFEAAVRIDPVYRKARENYALELEQLGQREAAPAQWRALLELDPTRRDARRHLGELFVQLDDLDAAIEQYERLAADDPSDVKALVRLGLLQATAGRTDEGVATLEGAVALAPDDSDAHGTLASVLFATGKAEAAVAQLREAARLDPERVELRYDVAGALASMGRRQDAVQELRDLLAERPDDEKARALLAQLEAPEPVAGPPSL